MTCLTTRRTLLAAAPALVAVAAGPASARSVQRLAVGDRLARFDRLDAGVRTYLRSIEANGALRPVDIWRREIRFETVDGLERLRIVQRWDGAAEGLSTDRDSLFEMQTFRPFTHSRIVARDGVRTIEHFTFRDDAIVGTPGVADNTRADYNSPSSEPAYNFETDMEMLQTLPLRAGYAVSIPFHHPGGSPTARYLWRVTGEDRHEMPAGSAIDCWVMETDYNIAGGPPTRFWFAKDSQLLIRSEGPGPGGAIVRKTLLG